MSSTRSPEDWANLGEWIAARRKQMGMDQRELAEAAGVSENTISNYERGRVPARGKVPPGYYRVERALQLGKGSVDAILEGWAPVFAVEGSADEMMRLRSPDDPALKNNPLLRDVLLRVKEAINVSALAMAFADLASRWNVSEELIERYKEAHDDLMAGIFSPGHGPIELQRYREAMSKGEVPKSSALEERPDLGWFAYAVDLEHAGKLNRIGDILRRARIAAGLSSDELSEKTKIPRRLIDLLEGDDFSFPGASMHVPVYLKVLEDPLSIEAEPLIERYKSEYCETRGAAMREAQRTSEAAGSDPGEK